jgi:hypothetical protein
MNKPLAFAIGLDDVLNRYWELANLTAENTKGSITGQLKALDSLCEQLALKSGDKNLTPRLPAQGFYQSQWMTDPRREN